MQTPDNELRVSADIPGFIAKLREHIENNRRFTATVDVRDDLQWHTGYDNATSDIAAMANAYGVSL